MSFNDQIKTIKRDNYNTPPVNQPLWTNPFLNLSTNEAYNALLNKTKPLTMASLSFNNLPKISNHANQDTVIDDDENLATHAMSEVYLDPGDRRDIQGFTRLPAYGTAETVVYKGDRSIVIGLRGSTMDHLGYDYVTDAEIIAKGSGIPFFTGSMEDRFRDANNTYRKIRRRYPNRHIIIGGHSLGNAITLDVLKQNPNDGNLSAYGFNGLAHPDHNEDSRFHHVRKEGDLVSYLGGKFKGSEIIKSSGLSRGKLLAATVGLASAVGLGRAAVLNRGIRSSIAARQAATGRANAFWSEYGNYITDVRPNLPPSAVTAQDSFFAKQIAKYAPGRPITDITDQVAKYGVGTGQEIIDGREDDFGLAETPQFEPQDRLFTDEPEVWREIVHNYAYDPPAYQSDILSGQGSGTITTDDGITGRVFSSNQIVDNPAMLENLTADSFSAAQAAIGEEAATASLASVLGTGAAAVLGPAALGVMGAYWLWSHSTSRFKPKKSLFIKKPEPSPGAPATVDELAAAKARKDRLMGDLKPLGIGAAAVALGGGAIYGVTEASAGIAAAEQAAADERYAAILQESMQSRAIPGASTALTPEAEALLYETPSIERTNLLADWAERFHDESYITNAFPLDHPANLINSPEVVNLVKELRRFKISGINGTAELLNAGLDAYDLDILEQMGGLFD